MNVLPPSLEDRLRDAYHAATQTVTPSSVPELNPRPRQLSWAARHKRGVAIMAPLAAAAAAAAIVVAAAGIAPTSGRPAPSQAAARGSAAPPFFIGPISGRHGTASLGVFSARTGRMTDLIEPPASGTSFSGAAATGQHLTFIVAASRYAGPGYTLFYRLTLSPRGTPARLAPLAVSRVSGSFTGLLTASADGQVIGFAATPSLGTEVGWVGVIHLAARQVRTWGYAGGVPSLTMSASGRTLEVLTTTIDGTAGPVLKLGTRAPAGSLTQRARVLVPGSGGIGHFGSIALTEGDRALLACSGEPAGDVLATYDSVTGAELAQLYVWRLRSILGCSIAAAPDGRHVLVRVERLVDNVARVLVTQVQLPAGQARRVVDTSRLASLPRAFAW